MSNEDRAEPGLEAPKGQLSRLSEASLRINEGLDLDTVLQVVLESARDLTEARYGAILLRDEQGRIADLHSSGLSDEEAGRLWNLSDGRSFFQYLGAIEAPLRVPDFIGHLGAQGLPEFRSPVSVGPVVGAPLRRAGERVGDVFLAREAEAPEFRREDEEVLVMFAAQAAQAIANARRYRDEQRARARLETLLDTCPIGVAVFDAQSGAPVSFNREAVRIFHPLMDPGQSVEDFLTLITIHRPGDESVSLSEFPLIQVISEAETVRAEEIEIEVPDGRSAAILVNATPIRSDAGDVESVVVTMQDMKPLQETERMRAEFLGMVSHELRTPLTSIKGSVDTLLDSTARVNPPEAGQLHRIIAAQTERMRRLISDLLDVARIETGALSVYPEPAELGSLVDGARRAFIAAGGTHPLELELPPALPWVMADRARIVQVLDNLVTNAARHSPDSSPITISAAPDGFQLAVSVSDHGRGIPAERLPYLFHKFVRVGSEEGGDTGLGLAVCRGIVEAHGGRITAQSDGAGLGARFTFTLPTVEETGFVSAAAPPAPAARRRLAPERDSVLAVDDDPQALRYIRDALAQAGYLSVATADPADVMRLVEETKPALVLLDVILPGADGIELMVKIRERHDLPIIFLSAYGQEELVARAFDLGAADYLVKPFAPAELAARIRAALRRQRAPEPLEPFVLGELTVDYVRHRATLGGQPLPLTALEYRTLAELARNPGRVVTYAELLRRVWGQDEDHDLRPMRTVIRSLRRRLGDDADDPSYIFTEHRVGYRLAPADIGEPAENDAPTDVAAPAESEAEAQAN